MSDSLVTLAKFLQDAQSDWKRYVDLLRDEYHCLNYFTTDQLVAVSSSIARLVFSKEPLSQRGMMLIKSVCPNLSTSELEKTLLALHAQLQKASTTYGMHYTHLYSLILCLI